ncbi:MAG TPA: hypothetical protein P5030_05060 [Rectinema sp.]|jgi:hypothetical protein|nr:hypothetical protein [Spirochaetaceae bacterium]HOM93044.1 hypothetical protein [Rectinema sp.]HOW12526.1 hypothetical protein [Rectinema sp.]HPG96869.1 hypothetical protein [Rectinema sp.]HRC82581.1 hypothetical protein [Rectinema sp.]
MKKIIPIIEGALITIVIILSLYSCDAMYHYQIWAVLPSDQKYSIKIKLSSDEDQSILGDYISSEIESKDYSGVSIILDRKMIGPGVIIVDLEKAFWQCVDEITFEGKVDGKMYPINKENASIYKANKRDIIIYINLSK